MRISRLILIISDTISDVLQFLLTEDGEALITEDGEELDLDV
jgi:hypothetical protein